MKRIILVLAILLTCFAHNVWASSGWGEDYTIYQQQSITPQTPPTYYDKLFFSHSDGKPYYVDSTGTVNSLSGSGTMSNQNSNNVSITGGSITGTTINDSQLAWNPITAYTTTPASTSTITMTSDLTASIPTGSPLKYVIGGVTYYGQVLSLTGNLMTIRGVSLSGTITSLSWGGIQHRLIRGIAIPGQYETSTSSTVIANNKSQFMWRDEPAYLIGYTIYSNTVDTGTKGQIDVTINGNAVNTTSGGLTITAATTWYNTVVDINPTYYQVTTGQVIEISSTKNGNGDAADLTVELRFVYP